MIVLQDKKDYKLKDRLINRIWIDKGINKKMDKLE